MLVSLKHKLAFLAVPKTGTTALETALEPHAEIMFRGNPRLKHMSANEFESLLRPYLNKMGGTGVRTMAIMRDPIDHLQSWYFYRRRLDADHPRKSAMSTRDITLEDFLEAVLAEDRPDYASIGKQSNFLCGARKGSRKTAQDAPQVDAETVKPMVDFVFPYERMDDAVRFLERRFKGKLDLKRLNASEREKIEIPQELRDRLERYLAFDYALYRRVQAGEFYPFAMRPKAETGDPDAKPRKAKATGKTKGTGAAGAKKRRQAGKAAVGSAPETPEKAKRNASGRKRSES